MDPGLKFPFGFLFHRRETNAKLNCAMEGSLCRGPDCALQPVSCPCLSSLCSDCTCSARRPPSPKHRSLWCCLSVLSVLAVAASGLSSNVAFQRGSLGSPCFVYQLWPSVGAVSVCWQFSLTFLPRSGMGVLLISSTRGYQHLPHKSSETSPKWTPHTTFCRLSTSAIISTH